MRSFALVLIVLVFSIVVSAKSIVEKQNEVTNEIIPQANVQNGNLEIVHSKPEVKPDSQLYKSNSFGSARQGEGRKKLKLKKVLKPLKKILFPIIVVFIIKAIILIPLALGILLFKTMKALNVAFVSFVAAIAITFWKLCTKVAHVEHPPVIHGGWDLDRSDPQLLAYGGYVPQ